MKKSNRSYFRACDRFRLSSVQRSRRLEGEKRRRKKDESVVKPKSAILEIDVTSQLHHLSSNSDKMCR